MEEIERLKQELKEALDKINEIDKELDSIKAKESRKVKWKPKEGDTYYFVNSCREIARSCWINDEIDNWRYNNLRIFETREECIQYKNFIEEVNKRKYEFSVEEWKDVNIFKYYICYEYAVKKIYVNRIQSVREVGTTYFKTKEDAQYIIDNYKEELLKYCFGIGE